MKQRIVTGVIAGAAFLTLLLLGGYWFAGLIYILAIIGYDEYLRMVGLRSSKAIWYFGLLALLLLALPWDIHGITDKYPVHAWIWLILFFFFAVTVFTKNKITFEHAAVVFLGIVYLGFGFHFMVETRDIEPYGLFWTLLVFVCIWAADSGAYFSGFFMGKHLLWPSISPKKTVEGAAGGILLSIVAALVFAWSDPDLLSYGEAVLLGAVVAVVGQLGDLIQSAYKRVNGIKDTGTILPGHGGVLDRVDSWLIVFPFIHLLGLLPQ